MHNILHFNHAANLDHHLETDESNLTGIAGLVEAMEVRAYSQVRAGENNSANALFCAVATLKRAKEDLARSKLR